MTVQSSIEHLNLWAVQLGLRWWLLPCLYQLPELLKVIRHNKQLEIILQERSGQTDIEILHSIDNCLSGAVRSGACILDRLKKSKWFPSTVLTAYFPPHCSQCFLINILIKQKVMHKDRVFDFNRFVMTVVLNEVIEAGSGVDSQIGISWTEIQMAYLLPLLWC